MNKVALITGITGQDGAYLAEFLLTKGYTVHGIKRRASQFNTQRIDHLYQDPHEKNLKLHLHYGDVTDSANLIKIIQDTQPLEIYNLAAMSHVKVSFDTPEYTANTDGLGALKAGAHVYVQKPTSVDVLEGEAMVAAARKYKRVVQVGTQRKSTPHLIEAKKNIVDAGLLGKVSHVEMCCYFHMRNNSNPPLEPVPDFLDYEMWTGPAPLRPYDGLPHIRWWRAFMEYGNGIMGDMCVHMLDTVRWMLDLGWPTRITSTGGIYVKKEAKSNIADTQSAIFEFEELNCVWQHRSWGTPADPDYPWSFILYGEKGTLKGSTMQYDFIPYGDEIASIHKDVVYEKEQYPEDLTEERIELNAAPATRLHMLDFLNAIDNNVKPVADIEDGHISSASCILANISMKTGRSIVYDPKRRIVVGDPEVSKLLQRAYRNPWVHPDPDNI